MVRVSGNVPLKRVKDAWEKLYNAGDINPSLNPKNLSNVLRDVGVNRAGQNVLFKELADMSDQLVYDLSSVFSRSMSISQAEKGYNKDKIQLPQINLALLCSADTGLPTMIRALPGSVKDIKTLYYSINELDIGGKILIVSDMDVKKQEIYYLYKKREVVEKLFDTYKTVLNADKLYLQDDESVFGHVFIAFLSLYIHCKLEQLLKKAELNHKLTPIDLLFKYSKVYHLEMRGRGMITEVPKKVRDLDEALGLYMFPKMIRS
jgi:transposase